MTNRNENQSRHIANSLRIIGMAGVATFGYPAFVAGDWNRVAFFGVAYVIAESVSYLVLNIKRRK